MFLKVPVVSFFNYFCVEKYALTDKNEQFFTDIQPFERMQKQQSFRKICHE